VWLAAASGGQDAQNALVLAIVGGLSALLVALATGLFQLLAAKQNRQQTPENAQTLLFERTAVLAARADDSDEERALTERRLDQIERRLDTENPNWRFPPDP
jgi:uncharacterized membrane protein YgaE (UPF0421/DUF939 family)